LAIFQFTKTTRADQSAMRGHGAPCGRAALTEGVRKNV
jgi:hypothetical protein